MIRCTDVCKVYQQGDNQITALAGVSLEIPRGAFAAVMGAERLGEKHAAAFDRRLGPAD